jgi:hypothetical protein
MGNSPSAIAAKTEDITKQAEQATTPEAKEALLKEAEQLQHDYENGLLTGPTIDELKSENEMRAMTEHNYIAPNYFPDVAATGMHYGPELGMVQRMGNKLGILDRLSPEMREGFFGEDLDKRLQKTKESIIPRTRSTDETNVLAPRTETYLHESSGRTFTAGVARNDLEAFVKHIETRDRNLAARGFTEDNLRHLGYKENGETVPMRGEQGLLEHGLDRRHWAVVYPDLATRWFRDEANFAKVLVGMLTRGIMGGKLVINRNTLHELDRVAEENAALVTKTTLSATRNEGVAIPRVALQRLIAHAKVHEPYPFLGQLAVNALNKWKVAVLGLTPRWFMNTTVGSFFQSMVKGTMDPRYYWTAMRIRNEDLKFHGHTLIKRLPMEERMPPTVSMGHIGTETKMSTGRPGLTVGPRSGLGKVVPQVRNLTPAVMATENFFRRAQFLHSLDKYSKMRMSEVGATMENYVRYQGIMRPEFLDEIIKNPVYRDAAGHEVNIVELALNDLDRFAYSYHHLGPFERRYVTKFVPFWGWYKWITQFMWRLPADYPGRANMMYRTGKIGQDIQNQLGYVPNWLAGAVFFDLSNMHHAGELGTQGLNPFGWYANPFAGAGRGGTIGGMFQLGQLNPVMQAGLAGLGINTMDATEASISPTARLAPSFSGQMFNVLTGEPQTVGETMSGSRALGTLMRSLPQIRMAEKFLAGGRSVYPESIPFFNEKPIAMHPGNIPTTAELLGNIVGLPVRHIDLAHIQQLTRKGAKYAKTSNQRSLNTMLQRLGTPAQQAAAANGP